MNTIVLVALVACWPLASCREQSRDVQRQGTHFSRGGEAHRTGKLHTVKDGDKWLLDLLNAPRKLSSVGQDSPLATLPVLNTAPPRKTLVTNFRREIVLKTFRASPDPNGVPKPKLRSPKKFTDDANQEVLSADRFATEMEFRTACGAARERVIRVRDVYPTTRVTYKPDCILLHRCDASTGCCRDPLRSCQPHTTEQVHLTFRTDSDAVKVARLTFTNHTSCGCFDNVQRHLSPPKSDPREELPDRHLRKDNTADNDNDDGDDDDNDVVEERDHINSASADEAILEDRIYDPLGACPRCPAPFSKRLMRGVCNCDCYDSDRLCLAVKHGHKPLAEVDRLCVHRRICQTPRCTTGSHFDASLGKCRRPIVEDDSDSERYLTDDNGDGDGDDGNQYLAFGKGRHLTVTNNRPHRRHRRNETRQHRDRGVDHDDHHRNDYVDDDYDEDEYDDGV